VVDVTLRIQPPKGEQHEGGDEPWGETHHRES
jgi:hypothetical protein